MKASANQVTKMLTGNEMVAEAAQAIDFHFMGYYPITPSTEIAQNIDKMKARGDIRTVLLAADGEHGAAGACFGATTGGARVLNATSANGLLYSLEQLPVQAGMRMPMVLNLVTRSVSGPLDIRCDHSDLMFALQTGWILLLASTPQAVYDMNILAVKLGEHPDVRLPVMVVSDGFFTSHQRQSVQVFEDVKVVQEFLGARNDPYTLLDPRKPVTVGPYMNDPDLINNKVQLHQAHEAAARVYSQLVEEYEKLCGRSYPAVEVYGNASAKVGLFLLNSAAETAKDAIDSFQKVSPDLGAKLLRPNLIRPFPFEALKEATHELKAVVIGERADTPGSQGGPLSHEVRSVLLADHHAEALTLIRVFGLGGKDFREEDALALLQEAQQGLQNPASVPSFGFIGSREGSTRVASSEVWPALNKTELNQPIIQVQRLSESRKKTFLEVRAPAANELTLRPKRIAPGHGACPGCGIFSGLDQFFKGISGDVVVLYHTGCAMVVTTDYPFSAHRVSYLHNLFQNGAPTLSGLLEVFYEKKRRGEIAASEEITFVMITGDGGMDIGMGPTIGTALRGHPMIIVEYDNQGYMNTGGQLSYTTPYGKATSTSHLGKNSFGKKFHHKDTAAIMAATGIPYVFTAVESSGTDLVEKAAKAQWYAQHEGMAFGKLLVSCPLNWGSQEREGTKILQKAVDSCFFPLFEVERGLTRLNWDPEQKGQKAPVAEWLGMMAKSKHLTLPEYAEPLAQLQSLVDERWKRLKARAEHPLL